MAGAKGFDIDLAVSSAEGRGQQDGNGMRSHDGGFKTFLPSSSATKHLKRNSAWITLYEPCQIWHAFAVTVMMSVVFLTTETRRSTWRPQGVGLWTIPMFEMLSTEVPSQNVTSSA